MTVIKCPSCGNAIDVPEKKSGLPWLIGCLVALIAIPVFLAIIGIMAAIAIPAFAKARDTAQRNACINNMKMIDAAKKQIAQEQNQREGTTIPDNQISEQLKPNGLSGLKCPKNGAYTINPIGKAPSCSEHGEFSAIIRKSQGAKPVVGTEK